MRGRGGTEHGKWQNSFDVNGRRHSDIKISWFFVTFPIFTVKVSSGSFGESVQHVAQTRSGDIHFPNIDSTRIRGRRVVARRGERGYEVQNM